MNKNWNVSSKTLGITKYPAMLHHTPEKEGVSRVSVIAKDELREGRAGDGRTTGGTAERGVIRTRLKKRNHHLCSHVS